jgi:hypothetical protein
MIALLAAAVGCGGGALNRGGAAGTSGPGTAGRTGAAGALGTGGTTTNGNPGTAGAVGVGGAGGTPRDAGSGLDFDGGVPIEELAHAYAVAACHYWQRCSPLAAYVVDECIEAMTETRSWHMSSFKANGSSSTDGFTSSIPSSAIIDAVREGRAHYDPEQELACLRSIESQACHGLNIWDFIPACKAAFTCVADAGPPADGGVFCSSTPEIYREPLPSCTSASDCAGVAPPGGPYCVQGYCVLGACSDSYWSDCPTAEAGQPCDSDPPLLGDFVFPTPSGAKPSAICSGGLTCAGLTDTGGLGVCAAPADLGGPCIEGAAGTGCALGLVCPHGVCEYPPSSGACESGWCRVGVAICLGVQPTCVPLASVGEVCDPGNAAGGSARCLPSLSCDVDTHMCRANTF